MFCREDLAGHFAVDPRTLVAGKAEVLYVSMRRTCCGASERDYGHAAPALRDEYPRALFRHYLRRKNLTHKATNA